MDVLRRPFRLRLADLIQAQFGHAVEDLKVLVAGADAVDEKVKAGAAGPALQFPDDDAAGRHLGHVEPVAVLPGRHLDRQPFLLRHQAEMLRQLDGCRALFQLGAAPVVGAGLAALQRGVDDGLVRVRGMLLHETLEAVAQYPIVDTATAVGNISIYVVSGLIEGARNVFAPGLDAIGGAID